jgi:hypothetical protein
LCAAKTIAPTWSDSRSAGRRESEQARRVALGEDNRADHQNKELTCGARSRAAELEAEREDNRADLLGSSWSRSTPSGAAPFRSGRREQSPERARRGAERLDSERTGAVRVRTW